MYSIECPINDMENTQDELSKNICNRNIPELLQNLIKRCLERDYI